MDARLAQHPTDQTLSAFGLGKLDAPALASVHQHLEDCTACRQRVASLSADSFLGRVRDAQAGPGLSLLAESPVGAGGGKSAVPPRAEGLPPGLADHPDYEIKKELGRGGMGVVYLAHNRLLGRDEVLKVMGRHIMERPGVLERFLREIQTVARLHHPNIVTAYHATRIGQSIVFVMEYVPGLDLARLVRSKGPLPVAHACYFVQQAALGLQHAHERGLVHRDIKPANLMLAKERSRAIVKVLDFGLAKATQEQPANGGLTSEGQMLGTPDCIAPEQIRNAQSADIRADIYSLGCTLYYLLTGGPPFRAESLWDLYQAHFSMDAGPLNLLRPDVPSELAALVAKMMAKEPEHRFQEPCEVAQALGPYLKRGGAAVERASPSLSQFGAAPARSVREALPGGAVSPPAPAAAQPEPEAPWGTLININIADEEEPSSRSGLAAEPRPRRRWVWPLAAVGALLFGFLAAWGYTVKVETKHGTIVLEGVPEGSMILLDGDRIRFAWPGRGEPVVIGAVAGTHKVEVTKGGVSLRAEEVTIQPDGGEPVVVRVDSPSSKPSVPGEGDDENASDGSTEPERSGTANTGQGDAKANVKADTIRANDGAAGAAPVKTYALGPSTAPPGWRVPGALARIRGEGELVFRPVPMSDYALETEVTFNNLFKGSIEYIIGARNMAATSLCLGRMWPRDDAAASVPCRVFAQAPTVVFWKGETHFPVGEKLRLTLIAAGGRRALLWNGRRVLEGGGEPIDATLRLVATGVVDCTVHSCVLRDLRPEDMAEAGWTAPEPVLRLDAEAAAKRLAAQSAGLSKAPARGQPFVAESVGAAMSWLPPGEFEMGSDSKVWWWGGGRAGDGGTHKVRLSRGFWMGRYEVTQQQWMKLSASNPSRIQGSPYLPVNWVSWEEASRYCAQVDVAERKLGRVPPGYQYRLPSEAEWEYACRTGIDEAIEFPQKRFWFEENSGNRLHEVGEWPANRWGLYDMLGNVDEWCGDVWQPFNFRKDETRVDPFRPPVDKNEQFPIRGGAWWRGEFRDDSTKSGTLCALRWRSVSLSGGYHGFRFVLGPIPSN